MISAQKKYIIFVFISLFASIIFGLSSCNDDLFSTDPKNTLSFSTDTLKFDTVFTSLGSATAKIMVYNKNSTALLIKRIAIMGGTTSSFHINVDGANSNNNEFEDIEIRAKDSLYIFVAITVDPHSSKSPLFIDDLLSFETNGVIQKIQLEAYGQNIKKMWNTEIKSDSALNDSLPYVVYGNLTVDSAKTLTLKSGTQLFFHNNANLVVHGNLKAVGTAEKPIIMRGDRLDKIKFSTPFPYNNVAGQWGGVYLLWNGGNHVLEHVNMNSGYVGVYISNSDRDNLPRLSITNCKIHNFLLYGLVAQNANVTTVNTEISNTSSYSVYLNGGSHDFIHCTIANYFNNSSVQPASRDKKPAVMIMNLNRVAPMDTKFYNCVISGNSENEFSLATRFESMYNGSFKNCYIKTPKAINLPQFTDRQIKWSANNDTVFNSTRYDYEKNTYFDFELDSVSPARGLADKAIARKYRFDLNGNSRMADGAPDAGAYEWQPKK